MSWETGSVMFFWKSYLSCFHFEHDNMRKVGWLCWGLTSQSTIFQSCRDGAIASWVINQYFRGVKCLAQGHNTAEVGLEPRTSRSGVRYSTTEPPHSPICGRKFDPKDSVYVKAYKMWRSIVVWQNNWYHREKKFHVLYWTVSKYFFIFFLHLQSSFFQRINKCSNSMV